MLRLRRLTPFLVNLALAAVFRAALPTTLAEGGERYLYYAMSLFFPYVGCTEFQCFRFLPPLLPSLLPLEVVDAFLVTGFLCQVLAGTLLWHVAERLHASRRVAFLTVCWYWAVWGPAPTLRDPLLIADPVQALWLIASLLLLLDGRYLLALPVLVSGAGVKESVLTVPVVYTAYLILSGEDIRRKIPWLAVLIAAPIATWVIVRRVLMTAFQYASPGDSSYLTHPYLFGLWLRMLGPFPNNLVIAALYIFSGFGAAWIFGALGLWRGVRRLRALSAASAPAMAFLALYQEPHRAAAAFPWAVLIPAAAYVESLPLPLVAAVLAVNAAFTIRMSATVAWLPSATVLLSILILLVAACLYLKRASGAAKKTMMALPAPTVAAGRYTAVVPAALAVLMLAVVGYRFAMTRSVRDTVLASPPSGLIATDDSGTPGLVLSPDDTHVVFTGRGGEVSARRLWISAVGSTAASPIAGTEGATAPFWSPEGRFLGFFAGGQLKKIDLVSGEVRVLASAPEPRGGAWAPGGTIIFAAGFGTPLQKVGATGGRPEPATALDHSTPRTMHRWPHMLPDGEHFLFTEIGPTLGQGAIRLGSMNSTDSRRLIDGAYDGVFVPPGFVIFGSEYLTRVRVQPFDLDRLSFFPAAVPASLPVALSSGFGHAAMAASARTIALALPDPPRDRPEPAQLYWYDREGRRLEDAADPDRIWRVASPDGRSTAATVRANDAGPWEIRIRPATGGSAGRTIVTDVPDGTSPTSWSPDGGVLLYQTTRGKAVGVWSALVNGGAPPTQLFRDALQAAHAQFSPDGRWIAYSAVHLMHRHVYVEPYPPTGEKWIVSVDGGEQPRWRADGRELTYLVDNRFIMAVDVRTDGGFRTEWPRRLFEIRLPHTIDPQFQYALSSDGQRLIVNTVTGPEPTAHVKVITNWTRTLRLAR